MKKILYSALIMAFAAFTLTSCEDVPMPYSWPGTSTDNTGTDTAEATGDGTLDSPFNCVAANEFGQALSQGDTSEDYYYIQGIIYSISEEFSSSYGNATFYMSDDGSSSNTFYVYRSYYLGNVKWTSSDTQIAVGDTVVVCAKIMNYYGTSETAQYYTYLYSLNGVTADSGSSGSGEATGSGTVDDPYNCVAANETGQSLSQGETTDDYYYIEGTVVSITEEFTSAYGNATFYISDDGTTTDQFYVYRSYYLGNQKWADGDTQIAVGDKVIICAKIMNYYGTSETAQYYTYLYSLNGVTADSGSGGSGEATGSGTVDDPYNCVAANEMGQSLSQGETTDDYYYIEGTVVSITEEFTSAYGNATFYISDDGTTTDQFYVYRSYYLGNQKWADGDTQIAVGDKVIICAKIMNYYGTSETAQYYTYLYSLNGVTADSGSGGSDDSSTSGDATITKSGNIVTITSDATASSSTASCDLNDYGWENAGDPETVTLTDGTTISFAQEGGNNPPKFYTATKGVRMYALNSMTIAGSKAIAKVVLTCDYSGSTYYVGNDQLYTSISGNTWKVVNDHTASSGGTQLRVQKIEITYAE